MFFLHPRTLAYGAFGRCIVWLLYGLAVFPDAPYHECRLGYFCGRTELPHSAQEYENFQSWRRVFFDSCLCASVAALYFYKSREHVS